MKKVVKTVSLLLVMILMVSMLGTLTGCNKKAEDTNVVTLYMMKSIDNTGSYDLVMEKANKIIEEKLLLVNDNIRKMNFEAKPQNELVCKDCLYRDICSLEGK